MRTPRTFMDSAYDNFTRLLDLCLHYHVQSHMDRIGVPDAQCMNRPEKKGDIVYNRWYVDGTLVLVHEFNLATKNQIIRTTNGDQWYSDDIPEGLFPAAEAGQPGIPDAFSAPGAVG